jgi:hypothetical protein
MKKIEALTRKLYADIPQGTLYHYTTFSGLLGIVKSRTLWASDIRYMNDSAELRHTANLIAAEARERIDSGHADPSLLSLFADWVSCHRQVEDDPCTAAPRSDSRQKAPTASSERPALPRICQTVLSENSGCRLLWASAIICSHRCPFNSTNDSKRRRGTNTLCRLLLTWFSI